MKIWKVLVIILICLIIIVGAVSIFQEFGSPSIGSNDLGNVDKYVYSSGFDNSITIAIISGMHPREKIHKTVLPEVAKEFASNNKCKVILYNVNVSKDTYDFVKGRANGESLVHDFVVKDLEKEHVDLVIIGHDHEKWYGEDYYIATPTMDKPSIVLAKQVTKTIGFNYYERNVTIEAKSTSIETVDKPIVKIGSKVFVYEIPENDSIKKAKIKTMLLLESSFNQLNKN